MNCKICGQYTLIIGEKFGTIKRQSFSLRHCPNCHSSFIANPWTEYAHIYSEDYYTGHGADPLVDYLFELEHPERTIRQYEWRGLLKIIQTLCPLNENTTWLDYGCGNGGLVRYALEHTNSKVFGYEEGCH